MIAYYQKKNGEVPVLEFFKNLPKQHQHKAEYMFTQLEKQGLGIQFPYLKILSPRIWKYDGKIFKLRVNGSTSSSRVLFCIKDRKDYILLHAFIKTTQKTPKKDAHISIANYHDFLNTGRYVIAEIDPDEPKK